MVLAKVLSLLLLVAAQTVKLHAQSHDCNGCAFAPAQLVCVSGGVTLPACLAKCQGLAIERKGSCQGTDDPLLSGLFVPLSGMGSQQQAPGAGPQSRSSEMSDAAEGSSSDGSSGSSSRGAGVDVVTRFATEGFVYAGHAALSDEGPTGFDQGGFVSKLTFDDSTGTGGDGDSSAAGGYKEAADSSTTTIGADGSSSSSVRSSSSSSSSSASVTQSIESSGDSGTGSGRGWAAALTEQGVPTQLRVRAVRVSPDGAVYIESSGVDLDLTQLPASAQTESKSSFEELDGLDPNGLDQSSPENATKSAALVGLASRRRRRLLRRGGQEGAQPLAGDWEADEASELPDGGDEDADGWFAARRRRLDQRRRRRLVDDSYRSDTGVWPYRIIGQLMYKVNTLAYICSGTWVSPYDVLTAAHCVFNITSGQAHRDFAFTAAKAGTTGPDGTVRYSSVTFYRAEYPRAKGDGVNYFDMALLRMSAPGPGAYMGIKYDCGQIDYPKTETCGYPKEKSTPGSNYWQYCDDCYYTSNACNPMIQPVNWCYTAAGQSGSPIYDLADYRVMGVLSGGPVTWEFASDLSFWTPIDAFHFASLTRWMWKEGDGTPAEAPLYVSAPPFPPPPPVGPYACSGKGSVRLAGGPDGASGRVQVCRPDGVWGSVCDLNQYSAGNADVVCRQLGYGSGVFVAGDFFPANDASVPVTLEPQCAGSEKSLSECFPLSEGDWSTRASCSRSTDMAVLCGRAARNLTTGAAATAGATLPPRAFPCSTEGAVRLQDGADDASGRVEICARGQWGSVCQDGWDDLDARVVCRQLGYVSGAATWGPLGSGTAPPGPAGMPVWMAQVACTGGEARLAACATEVPVGAAVCSHRADAGVVCGTAPLPVPGVAPIVSGSCAEPGALRLAVGTSGAGTAAPVAGGSVAGRLEVCYAGRWGAVCEAKFNDYNAQVACRQLGYTQGRAVPADVLPGQLIRMSEIRCQRLTGGAYLAWPWRLTSCPFWGMEDVSCATGSVAGVECTSDPNGFPLTTLPCSSQGGLRLRGGVAPNMGRLEVCNAGQWGTVCENNFGPADADVACRQLGYATGSVLSRTATPDGHPDSSIWMDELDCKGRENRLDECPFNGWGQSLCGVHSFDIGVVCTPKAAPLSPPPSRRPPPPVLYGCTTPSQLRLVDATGKPGFTAGRLELCLKGQWGTICDEGFGVQSANVACRQLGFAAGVPVRTDTPDGGFGYGAYNAPVHLTNVSCTGAESRLTQCAANNRTTCAHITDIGVRCFWPDEVPSVAAPPWPRPPAPVSPYACSDLYAVRLTGGVPGLSGRLDICYGNTWGTVCGTGFSAASAAVVCRELGLGGGRAVVPGGASGAAIAPADMPMQLDGVACDGGEARLVDCPRDPWGMVACRREDAVVVVCEPLSPTLSPLPLSPPLRLPPSPTRPSPPPPSRPPPSPPSPHPPSAPVSPPPAFPREPCPAIGAVRLYGGVLPDSGLLQVCNRDISRSSAAANNPPVWGAVCGTGFKGPEARAVCRQLGYTDGVVVNKPYLPSFRTTGLYYTFAPYPPGTPVWLDNVHCRANATRITDCSSNAGTTCTRNQEIALVCTPAKRPTKRYACTGSVGAVRLVGGRNGSAWEGNVQVCQSGTWGTVCDVGWDDTDARVLCRQLGYSHGLAVGGGGVVSLNGTAAGPFPAAPSNMATHWDTGVECGGSEARLTACRRGGAGGAQGCADHSRDAGAVCWGKAG